MSLPPLSSKISVSIFLLPFVCTLLVVSCLSLDLSSRIISWWHGVACATSEKYQTFINSIPSGGSVIANSRCNLVSNFDFCAMSCSTLFIICERQILGKPRGLPPYLVILGSHQLSKGSDRSFICSFNFLLQILCLDGIVVILIIIWVIREYGLLEWDFFRNKLHLKMTSFLMHTLSKATNLLTNIFGSDFKKSKINGPGKKIKFTYPLEHLNFI